MYHANAGEFLAARDERRGVCSERRNALADDVWPEVSSHYSGEEMARAARENSPGRVFFEVLLLLAVAGLMVVAAASWAPIFR
jgi:hypothetical protein